MSEVGLLMFRCVCCLMAFCWNCSEKQGLQDQTEYLNGHPTWEAAKGYRAPQTTEYVRCPNCIDNGTPIPNLETALAKKSAGKPTPSASVSASPSATPSESPSQSPTPSEFDMSRQSSLQNKLAGIQCKPCSPARNGAPKLVVTQYDGASSSKDVSMAEPSDISSSAPPSVRQN